MIFSKIITGVIEEKLDTVGAAGERHGLKVKKTVRLTKILKSQLFGLNLSAF